LDEGGVRPGIPEDAPNAVQVVTRVTDAQFVAVLQAEELLREAGHRDEADAVATMRRVVLRSLRDDATI